MVENSEEQGLGAVVRAARERLGWSQSELARRAQVAVPQISRLESNERPDVRWSTAVRLARALGLPLDDLAGERPEFLVAYQQHVPALMRIQLLAPSQAGLRITIARVEQMLEDEDRKHPTQGMKIIRAPSAEDMAWAHTWIPPTTEAAQLRETVRALEERIRELERTQKEIDHG